MELVSGALARSLRIQALPGAHRFLAVTMPPQRNRRREMLIRRS